MTVTQRILLLAGLAVSAMMALATLTYYQLGKVYEAASYAGVNTVPTYQAFFEIRRSLADLRERSLFHVIITDDAGMADMEAKIRESRAQLDQALNAYDSTACGGVSCMSDDKERQMFGNVKSALMEYDVARLKVFELSKQNRTKEAEMEVRERLMPSVKKLQDAIQVELDYNSELASKGLTEAAGVRQSALNISIFVALLAMTAIGLMSFFIIRNFARQLGGEPVEAAEIANKIAAGDLSSRIELKAGDNGSLLAAMKTMQDNLIAIVGEIRNIVALANNGDFSAKMDMNGKAGYTKELSDLLNRLTDTVDMAFKDTIYVAQALEQGDLTQKVTRDYQGAFDQVKQSLNNTVDKLAETMAEVTAAANQLGNASEQVSATSQSLSQASSEQAAGVEESTASIEQMSASINQNTENAKVTDGMATKAAKEAGEGGVAVKQTVDAMKDIAAKIGIIDDIAYQTNMLALNAAIEAARAGDHGKGFAVVAAEVRKLAERSQVAAQEIGELAESSVKTAEGAGKLLDEIVPNIIKTSELVQEIASASEEQSSGVAQVNTAMMQMNQITQQNASASEELAATAEEMTGQAEQLQNLMRFFRIADTTGAGIGAKSPARSGKSEQPRAVSKSSNHGGAVHDLKHFERF